jgi:hypothetical protein
MIESLIRALLAPRSLNIMTAVEFIMANIGAGFWSEVSS